MWGISFVRSLHKRGVFCPPIKESHKLHKGCLQAKHWIMSWERERWETQTGGMWLRWDTHVVGHAWVTAKSFGHDPGLGLAPFRLGSGYPQSHPLWQHASLSGYQPPYGAKPAHRHPLKHAHLLDASRGFWQLLPSSYFLGYSWLNGFLTSNFCKWVCDNGAYEDGDGKGWSRWWVSNFVADGFVCCGSRRGC